MLTARGTETSIQVAVAQATHDGFFSLVVPVGMRDIHVGLMFGHRYSWVQVESIQLIQRDALFGNRESEFSDDHLTVHLEGMAVRGPGLFECTVESGFLFVTPKPKPADSTPYVCRVVFRPLSLRDT